MNPNYTNFPLPHIESGVRGYIENGWEPGGFLGAVLENNLREAVGRGDPMSQLGLVELVRWLYNNAPAACWGSPTAVKAWLKMHRESRGVDNPKLP